MTLPAMNTPSFPEMYERFLVEPLFRPFAEGLLDRAPVREGDRVLDVACGTGIVARLAEPRVGATGRVIGTDVSPHMLAVARLVAPTVEWRQGPADALPLDRDERFDVVTCHQGLQFFPDRGAASREFRRALHPAGRVAVATWRSLETIPFVAALHRVAERHLGPIVDRRHSVGDPVVLKNSLESAGFGDVQVDTVTKTVRFGEGAVFVRMNAMALIGMSAVTKEMDDDRRADLAARIVEDSAEVLRASTDSRGLAFELSTLVAVATAR